MSDRIYRLSDFDFDLPPELVALRPVPARSASRLLRVDGAKLDDLQFNMLPELLNAGDVLVFNDTRVINSRTFRKPWAACHLPMARAMTAASIAASSASLRPYEPGPVTQMALTFSTGMPSVPAIPFCTKCGFCEPVQQVTSPSLIWTVAQAEFDRFGIYRRRDFVDERLAGEMDLRADRIAQMRAA